MPRQVTAYFRYSSGSCGSAASESVCSTDYHVKVAVTQGTTSYLVVEGAPGVSGPFSLAVESRTVTSPWASVPLVMLFTE